MSISDKLKTIAENEQKVYDKGRTDGYDAGLVAMWDAITGKGKRYTGERMFAYADFTNIEELPYPVVITDSAYRMFYSYYGKKMPRPQYIDLSKMDKTKTVQQIFSWIAERIENGWSKSVVIPDYGLPAMDDYGSAFSSSSSIGTITLLRVHEGTIFTSTFNSCSNLKNISFEGVIGRSISFTSCPLTVESMKNIILHLKNYKGTANEGTYTLTLKDTCKTEMAKLGAIKEFNNKTYDVYITDIGWNLA